jgi:WD40 repeat protein
MPRHDQRRSSDTPVSSVKPRSEVVAAGYCPAPGWKLARVLPASNGRAEHGAWSSDGRHVIALADIHAVLVFDATRRSRPRVISIEGATFSKAAWVPGTSNISIACFREDPSSGLTRDFDTTDIELDEEVDTILASYGGGYRRTGDILEDDPEDISSRGVVVVDLDAWAVVAEYGFYSIQSTILSLAWTPSGDRLATSDASGLQLWDGRSTRFVSWLNQGDAIAYSCEFSPSGQQLASVHEDGTIAIWDGRRGELNARYSGTSTGYLACCWLTEESLALAGVDGAVEVWSLDSSHATMLASLEGHTSAVSGLSVTRDRSLLAAQAQSGSVHLWRTTDWSLIAAHREAGWIANANTGAATFSPEGDALLTNGPSGLQVWDIDAKELLKHAVSHTAHYCNAKVALVGDSGVGKSGLALVLAGQSFRATESTHKRNVYLLDAGTVDTSEGPQEREVYLWDLAGQPGYRMLNQLQLTDVAVAVVIFDAHSETDPFAGVDHWVRALRQVRVLNDADTPLASWLLVAGRIDRGGPKVSPERIAEIIKSGFIGYFETSAKAGWAIEELKRSILDAIDWTALPKVSSTVLFDAIKSFVIEEQQRAGVLTTQEELRRAFVSQNSLGVSESPGLKAEFRTCVGRVAARGLLRQLSFGDLVLLKPEVLDSYVGALANAARDEPDGLGVVSEQVAYDGAFRIGDDDRIGDPATEKLLLIAAIEDLLRYELALREHSADGTYLVFPSQTRREAPMRTHPPRGRVKVTFEGPVQHIYATLVVRLSHSGIFRRTSVWRDAATFESVGVTCGISVSEPNEGRGKITLALEAGDDAGVFRQFQEFVVVHIGRKALPDTVSVNYVVACRTCGCELTDAQAAAAANRGKTVVVCPVCDDEIIIRQVDDSDETVVADVAAMTTTAASEARRAVATSTLRGKLAVQDFDVFLAYNSREKRAVETLAKELRATGINPWLDSEQVPPGRWFQDVIQAAIPRVRSAAIVIGASGIGRWEAVELRTFVAECVDRHLPVIPVLLPGASLPSDLPFLRQLRYVEFRHSVEEPHALDDLRWGITGLAT